MIATVTLNVAIDKRYVIENFTFGTVMRVKACTYTAGGKGINVSKVAALLGEPVTATGFVGGHAGEYIVEQLEQFQIRSDFVRVPGESRSCVNFYDEATKTQSEFLEPGVSVEADKVGEFIAQYTKLIENCSVVSISGSVPKGVDVSVYPRIIQIAKDMGKKVILDTSGKLLEAGLAAKPTMIKPNSDEIQALLGIGISNREELIAAAKRLHDGGIEVVVVSLGKEGALVVCKEGVFQGTTPAIEVVNTVGCGDSMVAGFAVGFARGESIEDTIRRAMAVSTANALTVQTGDFRMEDYTRLMNEVGVKKLG